MPSSNALPRSDAPPSMRRENDGMDWPTDLVGYDRDEWLRRYDADEDYWMPSPLHDPGDPCQTCEAYYDAMREASGRDDATSAPQMYVNGERVAPPSGHFIVLDSDMDRTRVYLARRAPSEVLGVPGPVERFPIKLAPEARLDVHVDGRLVASFVEHEGRAVDPAELLLARKAPDG